MTTTAATTDDKTGISIRPTPIITVVFFFIIVIVIVIVVVIVVVIVIMVGLPVLPVILAIFPFPHLIFCPRRRCHVLQKVKVVALLDRLENRNPTNPPPARNPTKRHLPDKQ